MLTVHHLGVSQSDRIVWLCEELEIPYQLRLYQRDATTQLAPAAYKALHPFGTAPVVTDGPLVLAESGAIIQYLIATYGNNRLTVAAGKPNFADYLFWFHFANGSLMPALMVDIIVARLGEGADPRLVSAMRARAERAFRMIERRLGETRHFAGDEFTAADIMMLFPLTTMRHFARRDLTSFANIRAYLARIGARPAFQRAMQKADPGFTPLLS
jgi:glutathione S-transferase